LGSLETKMDKKRSKDAWFEVNGVRLHAVEQGSGPIVLLCHGFPESSYSYRHQLPALEAAGFRAVAVDLRGFGESDRPEPVDQYSMLHFVGDLVGLLDALEVEAAVVVGHDLGASIAWQSALLRPDRFRAVVAMSVPFRPRPPAPPTTSMPQTTDQIFYQLYFQDLRVAAEFDRDVPGTLRGFFGGASGEAVELFNGMVPRQGGFFASRPPVQTPPWLTDEVLDAYAAEFKRRGFAGALKWCSNLDRNWELLAPFQGLRVTVPALFVAGERDPILRAYGYDGAIAQMQQWTPNLQPPRILPGCGHWTQQERPNEVNQALVGFLRGLGSA
jgi:pimeloyl-ACP methyl ester carboxylesterase